MGDEPGHYEESTYWEPSWTTARGAVMTSNVADIARSWRAVGTGALLSRASSRDQTGTGTVGLGINTAKLHWALGLWVTGGWIVATPSFAGYEAATAYLPPKRITIVVSSTRTEKSAVEGKPSVEIMQAIAAPLAPGNKIPSLGG